MSPAERLEHLLHPVTSFVIVPLFALANAGVRDRADALDAPGAVGVALGVTAGPRAWQAGRRRSAPPGWLSGSAWRRCHRTSGGAALRDQRPSPESGSPCRLFIAGLAFDDPSIADAAKLAVLAASVAASGIGVGILLTGRPRTEPAAK